MSSDRLLSVSSVNAGRFPFPSFFRPAGDVVGVLRPGVGSQLGLGLGAFLSGVVVCVEKEEEEEEEAGVCQV